MTTTSNTPQLTGYAHYLVTSGLLPLHAAALAQEQSILLKTPLINYLVENTILSSKAIALSAAGYFSMPFFNLDAVDIDGIPSDLIQNELVQKRYALPIYRHQTKIYLAVADPTLPSLNEVSFLTGLKPIIIIVEANKLYRLIEAALNNQLVKALQSVNEEELENSEVNSSIEQFTETESIELNNAPVVRFINKILLDAINKGASDIHFEAYEKFYRIRYRQDGILYPIATPPLKMANYLVARLKVMANLDISERRLPQDGRIKFNLSRHRSIDFRVSTCPGLWGEKVVMRLLESSHDLLNIDSLGMTSIQKQHFLYAIHLSQGLIIVTGPTGSGKTVTLYTALDIINSSEVNISTIEDPVEINLQGVNQVQVNPKIGLSFSDTLRAFLRQDPDIIMVGEIRDTETAEIAIKAAQTGHLVLSTLHTNSASQTLVRLANMGIPTYNIASSISLIIAQRLARRLCPYCKRSEVIPEKTLRNEGFLAEDLPGLQIFSAGSCERCINGYTGRMGIYEVMPISESMGRLVMTSANAMEIDDLARKEGIDSLRRSALQRVKQGETSLEEINRVIQA